MENTTPYAEDSFPPGEPLAPIAIRRDAEIYGIDGGWFQILRPEGTEGAGVTVWQDAHVNVSRLDPGAVVEHAFGGGRGGYFYLIQGQIELNGEGLATGDAAKILGQGLPRIRGRDLSELILVDTPL